MTSSETRLYGMADDSNRQASADNGLRGEGATDATGPLPRRTVALPERTVQVEETSGIAYAEAGMGSRRRVPERPSVFPWPLVAAALGIGYLIGRRARPPAPPAPEPLVPAAMTRLPGEPESYTQVRDAGPEEVRDLTGRWTEVDEAVDESFPASDPPAYSIPGR